MKSRVAMWVGHYFLRLFAPLMIITILGLLIGGHWWDLVLLPELILVLAVRYHDRQLCERCIDEVPFLNPEAAVQKYRRQLRFQHSNVMLWFWTVFLASSALQVALPRFGGGYLPFVGFMLWYGYTFKTHQRLYPWCPHCDHGHGGGGEDHDLPPDLPDGPREEIDLEERIAHQRQT